jgi:hypothetical protein
MVLGQDRPYDLGNVTVGIRDMGTLGLSYGLGQPKARSAPSSEQYRLQFSGISNTVVTV